MVPVIVFGVLLALQLSATFVTGDDTYYTNHQWLQWVGILIASGIVAGVGYRMNMISKNTIYRDENNNAFHRPSHDFFFIPMQYWGGIIPALFLLMVLSEYR